jgi:hypothetical protein
MEDADAPEPPSYVHIGVASNSEPQKASAISELSYHYYALQAFCMKFTFGCSFPRVVHGWAAWALVEQTAEHQLLQLRFEETNWPFHEYCASCACLAFVAC